MYSFLPDELLKEILAPALQVPDHSFACNNGNSPFSNFNPTTSAYLLVCKDWLRVATPLLYNVAVLRSKAQIQALETTLDSTPELAVFIKKLRIESGYCSSLLKILKASKGLTDLCVSLEVYSSDNVSAFRKGLAFVHPRRLIIYDRGLERRPANKKVHDLVAALNCYIPEWEMLVDITLPGFWRQWTAQINPESFAESICKSKSIQFVSIKKFDNRIPQWLRDMATVPTLKQIKVVYPGPKTRWDDLDVSVAADSKLRSVVRFIYGGADFDINSVGSDDTKSVAAVPVKTPSAGKGIATFPDRVWSNILFFALRLPELELLDSDDLSYLARADLASEWKSMGQQLALVCRKFHELSIPLFYHCVVVKGQQELNRLVEFLSPRAQDDKRARVKTLLTIGKGPDDTFVEKFKQLLGLVPNVRRISNNVPSSFCRRVFLDFELFDWDTVMLIAQKAGRRLEELNVTLRRPGQPKAPSVFSMFTALRHLEIESAYSFTFEPSRVDKLAFPALESLECRMSSNTFLLLLSHMNLPSIRTAKFPSMDKCDGAITFLKAHGHKLTFLECGFLPGICIFDTCSQLLTFEIPQEKPGFAAPEFFSSTYEHPLELIRIKFNQCTTGSEAERFKYLGNLELSNFTSLREIVVSRCHWPKTENEIRKSKWVPWAERLVELYGVSMSDRSGQKWVPRLKARK